MPYLSIAASARATGKDRSTIQRYVKDGRLSCTTDTTNGRQLIDTSELMRVFGELKNDGAKSLSVSDPEHRVENYASAAIEALKEQLKLAQEREHAALMREERLNEQLKESEEWLKKQLETAQCRIDELEKHFLALPEGTAKKPGSGSFDWFFRFFGFKDKTGGF
jgi:hypothetical protein